MQKGKIIVLLDYPFAWYMSKIAILFSSKLKATEYNLHIILQVKTTLLE
jgi:hypothetical protein